MLAKNVGSLLTLMEPHPFTPKTYNGSILTGDRGLCIKCGLLAGSDMHSGYVCSCGRAEAFQATNGQCPCGRNVLEDLKMIPNDMEVVVKPTTNEVDFSQLPVWTYFLTPAGRLCEKISTYSYRHVGVPPEDLCMTASNSVLWKVRRCTITKVEVQLS